MKPPNLWRLLAAAIPSLSAIPAIVALALTSAAGSAAAQEPIKLKPVPIYGCAKGEPAVIRPNNPRIPGTNTVRFQVGGGDYPAQGFIPAEVILSSGNSSRINVDVKLIPEKNVDPIRGPINCFEVDLPFSEATYKISYEAVLYESDSFVKRINQSSALFTGPRLIEVRGRYGCERSAPTIILQGGLRIPGINTIRFQGGAADYPGSLQIYTLTLEEASELVVVRAQQLPQIFGPIFNCFEADIPISNTTREVRFIADFFKDGAVTQFDSSSQTSLFLTPPVTTPAPTLSFWALLVLAIGAFWVGYKRLQAKRANATTGASSFALLALALGLLAPPRPMHKTSRSLRLAK